MSGFDQATRSEIAHRSRGNCEARLRYCFGRATHIHHRQLRAQGGPDTVDNGLHVCAPCHKRIHEESGMHDRGLLVHAWDDPAAVPIVRTF